MLKTERILTVSLEDYFQVLTFRKLVSHEQWNYFEARLEQNTARTLDLLDRYSARATFFVVGWIAERYPSILREVVRRGHEVANKGYYLRSFRDVLPMELRENMARARDAIEKATGQPVLGCRVPQQWFSDEDLWALDILAEEGYQYDSSMVPMFWSFRREPWRRFVHEHKHAGRSIWEFPISTCSIGGCKLPIAGGNYMRQIPRGLIRKAIEQWDRTASSPFVMYFHVWELDPGQVRISAASALAKLRHYRNLDRMPEIIEGHLDQYRFCAIRDYLRAQGRLPEAADQGAAPAVQEVEPSIVVSAPAVIAGRAASPVTLVIPCYNEEFALPYLAKNLESLRRTLAGRYEVHYVFVDDHSSDETPAQLRALFGSDPEATIMRHPENLGVAAAIMTGIQAAKTEIVCSLDCDCTYDPAALAEMIPMLSDGVDMVTASPYHPQGKVENVPGWRLGLSKVASRLYGTVLRQRLSTYTSCFRVYRRSSVKDLRLQNGGFIGVAELLGLLDLAGGRVVEFPATLRVRLIGRSKMKVLRAIWGHVKLMMRLRSLRRTARLGNWDQRGGAGAMQIELRSISNKEESTTL